MYKTILTHVGLAAIAAATANGTTVSLYQMAVGDGNGNATTPDPAQSSLVRETYRAQLNTLAAHPQNPNQIIAEMVIPVSVGGFVVREIGLFDNGGTLIAVGNCPAAVKPVPADGAMREMVIRMVIEVSNTSDFQLVIDPSVVLATRDWCSSTFTLSVTMPGGTTGQVLRKKTNTDGDVEWYDPASGMTILVDTVEENQQLAAGQTIIDLAIATTAQAAVYVDGIRLRSDQWTATSTTRITLASPATAGQHATIVQNDPGSASDYLRSVNDLSEIAARGTSAKEAALANLGLPAGGLAALTRHILQALQPVGSLYTTTSASDPAAILGFGSWERYGAGRALVGLDATDADFNAVGKTGGAKVVTLTKAQLPAEPVAVPQVTLQMNPVGDHVHQIQDKLHGEDGNWTNHIASGNNSNENTLTLATTPAGGHTPSGIVPAHNTAPLGSGQAHSNLQPYITIAVWRRVA